MNQLDHNTRSAVFTALFNLLQTTPPPTGKTWKTFSQALISWEQIDSDRQPAMFLHRGPQSASQKTAYDVTKWIWKATVWVYFRTDGLNTVNTYPDQLTDQIIDNIEQVMRPAVTNGQQTLGGACYHAFIEGTIVWDTFTDGQAVIVVPITIYV